jgi:RecA-family ATPase
VNQAEGRRRGRQGAQCLKVRPVTKGERGYGEDYSAVAALTKLAGDLGVAIIAVHHTRKAAAEDPFETVSGTFGVTGGGQCHSSSP